VVQEWLGHSADARPDKLCSGSQLGTA
jgi:hypothetical protein